MNYWVAGTLCFLHLLRICSGLSQRHEPTKMILDTDFTTINDDGQVLVMAAQLHAARKVNLLGVTVPSGNAWRVQEVSNCLKGVERLGIEHRIGVYEGANEPFLHTYETFLYEKEIWGDQTQYVGAYTAPPLKPEQVTPPPDGFATHTKLKKQSAVDFIIKTVHKYPYQVSIVAIGPLTNIALALRLDPTIEPLIKEIVIMGGQIETPGNSFHGAGEFNWWFDPESVQVVLRANISRVIVPLDVTTTVPMLKSVYEQIANHTPSTVITKLYAADYWNSVTGHAFDQIAMAVFYNSTLVTNSTILYVDINACLDDQNYSKSIFYTDSNVPNSVLNTYKKSEVVFGIDNDAFYALYVDLMTRNVPVSCGA